jgi:hypothetical protein
VTKPITKKEVYLADQVYTVAFPSAKPIAYREYVLPEYFYATAYFFDSDGVKVTKANAKDYKAWSVELLIRVKENESLEVITSTIKGARTYKGHVIVSLTNNPVKDLDKTATVKATYYKYVADHRAKLIAFAITSAVQSFVYKKEKDGSNSWPLFSRKEISEDKLQGIAKKIINESYVKKDQAFYLEVARLYREAVLLGEHPNNYLRDLYGKDKKTVQGWTTEARKRGLLEKATEKGKVSRVRKNTRKEKG